ncbi:AAA family ATPase [Microbacterium sp. VKM Ac-2923]|uniref:AAA family ATPase n=1 Tax=Microbacterium sp. VKM Ac-2923 TaxID=2929476 RepID=UPI001FB2B120|nr:AAA family ATPase [Microbacterium sp. VKM Ac-2923]MCJ1707855.1 AAA family ATPase [Microbacterium sp. VKM Ac-2923]
MKLSRIDVRFFRSFNFDFEHRARESSEPAAWEDSQPWHPFVRVRLEPDITAVVGANEAGKSQLLRAVQAGLTGSPIRRQDFCRYSEEYSVQAGQIRLPEFGVTITLEEGEQIVGVPALRDARTFSLYRPGSDEPFLVIDETKVKLPSAQLQKLEDALPDTFELKTGVAIPDSVSIAELTGEKRTRLHERRQRSGIFQRLFALPDPTAAAVGEVVAPALAAPADEASESVERQRRDEFELARMLLVDAAKIDPRAFAELKDALASGREGQVEAVVGAMNTAVRENLNVQRWWTQDREFELVLEAREHELAFTIRDRTGATYSFGERSQGLRYFLSYFVQLAAHRLTQTRPDVLLLDEPDAFLSSIGQQDLLRVLRDYALPEDGSPGSQVIYVTHSPFLIDKNAPERIRVLDKGSDDEGTRVVHDAANNRYEPLRSSLGSHVAETAFIGGQNLFVEGLADQLLIAGVSAHLSRRLGTKADNLNLNDVTIVAAGGADGIPYLVYLARGRDSIKPPCVALLDGDVSGTDAAKVLKRGEARKKRVLKDEYVVMLDQWAKDSGLTFDRGVIVEEIEDLLPVPLVHRAALAHLTRFVNLAEINASKFPLAALEEAVAATHHVWEPLRAAYEDAFPGEHIEKVGLARELVALLESAPDTSGVPELRERFENLLTHLAAVLDAAKVEEDHDRSDDKVKRSVRTFLRAHTQGITKRDARRLLRELADGFSQSDWVDEATKRIATIRQKHELEDLTRPTVEDFEAFRTAIRALGEKERQAYQDDATQDPAAPLLISTVASSEESHEASATSAPVDNGDHATRVMSAKNLKS